MAEITTIEIQRVIMTHSDRMAVQFVTPDGYKAYVSLVSGPLAEELMRRLGMDTIPFTLPEDAYRGMKFRVLGSTLSAGLKQYGSAFAIYKFMEETDDETGIRALGTDGGGVLDSGH